MSVLANKVVTALQKDGLLNRQRLSQLKQFSSSAPGNVLDFCLLEGVTTDRPIDRYLREVHRLPVVCLDDVNVDPIIVKLLPRSVCLEHTMVIFHRENGTVYVAMVEPENADLVAYVKNHIGLNVVPFLADRRSILHVIAQIFDSTVDDQKQRINELIERAKSLGTDAETMAKETPIIQLLDHLMVHAIRSAASDLHLEPSESDVVVRLRVDGLLHEAFRLPMQLHAPLVARIKILSKMRIDEHLRPQDARFTFMDGDHSVAVRVSIVPALYGQKAVLRFLDTESANLSLDRLGLCSAVRQPIDAALKHPHGLILVTGPTGSGKTTTLYAMLNALRRQHVNISTIEDPVEYHIPGVTQIPVNPLVGLTFATGLRSILRQDPDIILVGEIRDKETADIAINAALTGHLVVSTLHTNSAAAAITRLLDIGIEPYLIASTLRAVINQRLVRMVCPTCREMQPVTVWPDRLAAHPPAPDQQLAIGQGCNECHQTGYRGRTGVFEVMTLDESLHQHVMHRANANDIERLAISRGMTALLDDATNKIFSHQTTPQEVLRVVE